MHATCAGVTYATSGFRIETVDARSWTPSLTIGSVPNVSSALNVVVRRALNAGDCSSAGVPTVTASARSGDAAANALKPGWKSWNSAALLFEQAGDRGEVADADLQRRRALGDRVLDRRERDVRERAERLVEIDVHLTLDLRDRGDRGGALRQAVPEAAQVGLRAREVAHHGLEVVEQRAAGRGS